MRLGSQPCFSFASQIVSERRNAFFPAFTLWTSPPSRAAKTLQLALPAEIKVVFLWGDLKNGRPQSPSYEEQVFLELVIFVIEAHISGTEAAEPANLHWFPEGVCVFPKEIFFKNTGLVPPLEKAQKQPCLPNLECLSLFSSESLENLKIGHCPLRWWRKALLSHS